MDAGCRRFVPLSLQADRLALLGLPVLFRKEMEMLDKDLKIGPFSAEW
jgi:hypothetical protein